MLGLIDGARIVGAVNLRAHIIRSGGRRAATATLALALALTGLPAPAAAEAPEAAAPEAPVEVPAAAPSEAAPAPAEDAGAPAPEADLPTSQEPSAASDAASDPVPSASPVPGPAARAATVPTAADWISIRDAASGEAASEVEVGQTLRIDATYEDPYSDFGDEADFTDAEYAGLSIQWYAGTRPVAGEYDAAAWEAKGFTPIGGATARTLTVTEAEVGSYIAARVVNPGGRAVWASTTTGQVVAPAPEEPPVPADPDARSLAEAVAALAADGFGGYYPNPRYGTDTNLNAMIEARLAALGHPGITARVSSAEALADPAAAGGVDASATDANGAVTYFFLAPDQKTTAYDYSVLRQVKPTFELSLGDARATYTPPRATTLAWDEAAVEAYLADAAAALPLPDAIASGSVGEQVTEASLPADALGAGGVKVASIAWKSSDPSAAKVQAGFDASYNSIATAKFTHQPTPAAVTLTATLTLRIPGYGSAPATTFSRDIPLEVAPRSGATTAQVERRLKTYLAKVKVTDFATGAAVSKDAVAGDLQFSRPRELGLDGRAYKLSYVSADEGVVRISGYRGSITPALAGDAPRQTSIKAVLTYEGVTVERELGTFTMAEVGPEEIDAAVALMESAKAGYAAHLLGANAAANQVTGDLATFAAVLPGTTGPIWARTAAEASTGGITPVDLPGYDPMSSQPWRTFRSSNDRVVASESLRVTRPAFDAEVTVDSVLTYRRYEALALAHPENAQLAKLIAQPVSATFTVRGTKGAIDPEAAVPVSVTASVTGVTAPAADGSVRAEAWVRATAVTFKKGEAKTAWDVFAALLDKAGFTYDLTTGVPGSVTSADGRTLGMEQIGGDWAYWSFLVNGAYASDYANKVELAPGDRIELVYVTPRLAAPGDGGETGPVIVPDAPRPDVTATWSGFANGGRAALEGVATPGDAARALWSADLKRPGEAYAAIGDPIIVGDHLFATTSTELVKIDRKTGAVVARVKTYGSTSYFSRAVFAAGVIIVPSDDGSLAAFTADTLTCVWKTPALVRPVIDGRESSWQAGSTLTVADGSVIAPFVAGIGASGAPARAGALVSVRIADGAVLWTKTSQAEGADEGAGYYWAGAAVSGSDIVIGDESGTVSLIDAATGETRAALTLGSPVRSTVVAGGEEDGKPVFFAAGRAPATLYKIVRDGDALVLAGQVAFAASSTSTPSILGKTAFVGGADAAFKGVLAEIDTEAMTLKRAVTVADAEVKSAPLVTSAGGRTYVYVTANMKPGALIRYEAGTGATKVLYEPTGEQANYTTASVIAGADGTLYYSNDAGVVFAIGAAEPGAPGDGGEQPGGGGSDGGGEQPGGGSDGGGREPAAGASGSGTGAASAPTGSSSGEPAGATAAPRAGVIAPGRRPIAGAARAAATGAASAVVTGQSGAAPTPGGPASAAPAARAAADVAANAAEVPSAQLPWVLAAIGALGLIVSGLWFLVIRRRERGEA